MEGWFTDWFTDCFEGFGGFVELVGTDWVGADERFDSLDWLAECEGLGLSKRENEGGSVAKTGLMTSSSSLQMAFEKAGHQQGLTPVSRTCSQI